MRAAMRSLLLAAIARTVASSPATQTRGDRILLIRPDHLGDVLFLTPALAALRAARPDAELTVLVGPWARPLLAANPDLDRVETIGFPWFDRRPRAGPLAPYRLLLHTAQNLRGRYDVAVICRFDHWWGAMLAAAARIPRVIGYDVRDVRPFVTEAVPYDPWRHEVQQNATLLARLGAGAPLDPARHPLRFAIGAEARARAATLLTTSGLNGPGPLVAIHPGSGAPVKRWTGARWGALMRALRDSHEARFVITGGRDEIPLASSTVRAAGNGVIARSVAGASDLETLGALYERCALVVGPDSGPLHLAVAAGRPTLHLYGPVDPRRFGPWGRPAYNAVVTQALACQFCHRLDWPDDELRDHPCVSGIPLEWVVEGARALLDRGPEPVPTVPR